MLCTSGFVDDVMFSRNDPIWRVMCIPISWNSSGRTPTLGMRLSCIFVNVYTIAYRVQYTFTRVHTRLPNGHPREEKRTCRTSRRTSRRGSSFVSGSDKRAALPQLTASCGKLNGRHADILATILAKMSVSVAVSVSVSVPWNPSFTKLNNQRRIAAAAASDSTTHAQSVSQSRGD